MPFNSPDGDLEQIFLTDYELVDQYVQSGTLWAWGRNNYGQLGNNTRVNRSSPVQTIASGTNWKSIASGYLHSLAIKTDGTLWTWGHNYYGQLGDDTIFYKSSPVQTIASGTNWKSIASGTYHSLSIRD